MSCGRLASSRHRTDVVNAEVAIPWPPQLSIGIRSAQAATHSACRMCGARLLSVSFWLLTLRLSSHLAARRSVHKQCLRACAARAASLSQFLPKPDTLMLCAVAILDLISLASCDTQPQESMRELQAAGWTCMKQLVWRCCDFWEAHSSGVIFSTPAPCAITGAVK